MHDPSFACLKKLLDQNKITLQQVLVDETSAQNEDLWKKIEYDAVFLPSKANHTPSGGSDQVNDDVVRMDIERMQTNCSENRKGTKVFKKNHYLSM